MNFVHARAPTEDQAAEAQLDALVKAGCELTFKERAAGGPWDRPEPHRILDRLRESDAVMFCL